jgi:hypothetical protein
MEDGLLSHLSLMSVVKKEVDTPFNARKLSTEEEKAVFKPTSAIESTTGLTCSSNSN